MLMLMRGIPMLSYIPMAAVIVDVTLAEPVPFVRIWGVKMASF